MSGRYKKENNKSITKKTNIFLITTVKNLSQFYSYYQICDIVSLVFHSVRYLSDKKGHAHNSDQLNDQNNR